MQKKKKVSIFLILSISLSVFIFFHPLFYYKFLDKDLTVINNTVYASSLPDNTFKSTYTPKIKFEDRPITKVNGISLNILNESNITNVPMLLKSQRYYIPLNFICNKLNYTIDTSNNKILLSNKNNKISLTENSYTKNSGTGSLRGDLINNDGVNYISISDIEELFNLIAIFDFKNNSISLLDNSVSVPENPSISYSDKVALIRLEDFGCGGNYSSDKNQTKIKLMANLFYSQGMKYHVSWIPRFKSPTENIDNDLLTTDNITNVGFVNLLDYLINKGGEIGLHGYTHQHDDEKSGPGNEMTKDVNNTVDQVRDIVEKGIDTASALNIPISYYESPHYGETELQRNVIEDYFQFIYEPFDSTRNNIYNLDDYHLFVPTPLGYVHNSDPTSITDGLNNDDPDILHSFYYHPFVELNYVHFNIDDNKLNVTYDENSPLQKIVKTLKSDNYVTVHIDELIDK
ncbi:hypothetical protein CBE01nite_16360 [Clostridium beijerinckii]|uniref:DUF2334 domain-containing protein n=1 Tax=Clostridium beijerinckii TaxID=1520 RepID=A0AB74VA33_CLOBE|nr:DUF2334 domain-containing protein [Clostridium beijerinckii]NRZ27474.1 peptidoglycan/xylan/chitin deacetylase (PgdA/CDA1 family) [Clostridium beijerinckii]NYB96737.1 peptidoglycan/xylan/chitin deacetylase (PgdA/CDA1 family) [Clostridium beijerinckii]OOM26123.1 hypothetical protein CLBEI_12470 [Clostridium beijerinckii]QUN33302.1 DUF2334 domain-containing protein [Clostridium beijerinckii]SQB19953.1 Uncharacterized protein conserved in bacteria [Clostridium beijerinckii]